MRGKVLGFDHASGTGMISGDYGNRYAVVRGDIQAGASTLMVGGSVDFEVSDKRAISVYVITPSSPLPA